jgi:Sec-independent protein secretion pathway component TatC
MPKFFGTSLAGILAATVVLYMLGFLWYGFIFTDAWLAATGMSAEEAKAIGDAHGPMMFVWGILITLLQVLGLTYILNHSGASVLATCVKICAIVALLIALPIMAYASLYEGRSINGLFLDLGHIFVGYCLVGAVISFFRGKDAIGD